MYRYVFSADIVKMFRQIWVSPDHQNYQRIVWREHPSAPLKHYQLDTVTYGTACAPYLAVRVLEQLAYDHKEQYPTASKILLEDFYVDDVLTGSNNENELIAIRNELLELMSHAKLELDKWVSNSSRICRRESSTEREEEAVKVLGIYWNSIDDQLMYKTCLTSNPNCTKRQILSDVARIFDPLGLLSPIVVQFKIMFQQLWLLDLGWDTKLPPNIAEPWLKCRADLDTLKRLRVPRFVPNREDSIELHAFSDASTKAYAAAVYCRFRHEDGTYSVSLVAAKTRVAPLKQQSLPRLELCGALLLSRLVRSLKDGLRHKDIQVYAWCDSTIVLAWLSYPPSKMKTFVANRTSEILETLPRHAWHHVSSKENPADCASRGMMATQLMEFHLWWNGPTWLHDEDEYTVKMQTQTLFEYFRTHAQDELKTTAMLTLKR
ncbi:SD27140p [Wolbachia endosymbiont of Drosophila ananassae]|nr:SD27140p [Wolbachia endosymbiont of Drosophila ananassae]